MFVKRNKGKISIIFAGGFLAKPQCKELLAKYFSINVIIVLIIQKIIKFQKLKHLQNLV